jgi:hypothetical protein
VALLAFADVEGTSSEVGRLLIETVLSLVVLVANLVTVAVFAEPATVFVAAVGAAEVLAPGATKEVLGVLKLILLPNVTPFSLSTLSLPAVRTVVVFLNRAVLSVAAGFFSSLLLRSRVPAALRIAPPGRPSPLRPISVPESLFVDGALIDRVLLGAGTGGGGGGGGILLLSELASGGTSDSKLRRVVGARVERAGDGIREGDGGRSFSEEGGRVEVRGGVGSDPLGSWLCRAGDDSGTGRGISKHWGKRTRKVPSRREK